MAEQQPQSNPQVIRAYNKKGITKNFTPLQWKLMKTFPDGTKQGWTMLKDGETVQGAIKSANIPAELKKFSAGGKVDLDSPEIKEAIEKAVDERTSSGSNEMLTAKIRKEVEADVAGELEEARTAQLEIKKLSDFILDNHSDKITEGSAVDVAIAIMSGNEVAEKPASAAKNNSGKGGKGGKNNKPAEKNASSE